VPAVCAGWTHSPLCMANSATLCGKVDIAQTPFGGVETFYCCMVLCSKACETGFLHLCFYPYSALTPHKCHCLETGPALVYSFESIQAISSLQYQRPCRADGLLIGPTPLRTSVCCFARSICAAKHKECFPDVFIVLVSN
jgi:hypothetical protein